MRKIQFECMRLIAVVIAMFAAGVVALPAFATTPPTPEVTTAT